jgi:hypothetical protein
MSSFQFLNETSMNKVAFPKARVFIFGKEVSADVLSVRINQTGGSVERSPSTCSITLANVRDDYVITKEDIYKIGEVKGAAKVAWAEKAKDWATKAKENYEKSALATMVPPDVILSEIKAVEKVLKKKNQYLTISDPETIQRLAKSFVGKTNDEIRLIIQALLNRNKKSALSSESYDALIDAAKADIESKARKYKENYNNDRFNPKTEFIANVDAGIPGSIKRSIINKKIKFTSNVVLRQLSDLDFNDEESFNKLKEKMIYTYPMMLGDTIFHPNDPVRVAFRDPFDPKRWYWMFTGFVDSCSESCDVNMSSSIDIFCTDVTKMARYSVLAEGVKARDEDFVVDGAYDENISRIDPSVYENKFSRMTVFEVLESIFYGTESTREFAKSSAFNMVNSMKGLTYKELKYFFDNSYGIGFESFVEGMNIKDEDKPLEFDSVADDVRSYLKTQFGENLNRMQFPAVSAVAPFLEERLVKFKRRNKDFGVTVVVYGEPDITDKTHDPVVIEKGRLGDWNEIIHHRVRPSDIAWMRKEGDDGISYRYGDLAESSYDITKTIDQVIYEIGTDIENYPVGGGRVFYMAPARMASLFGASGYDKGFNSNFAMNVVFYDRLTFIYDLASNMDFRFYATPKGDIVFEMPFYDYDPQDFFDPSVKYKDDQPEITDWSEYFDAISNKKKGEKKKKRKKKGSEESETTVDTLENIPEKYLFHHLTYPYNREFVITKDDQMGYSNSFSDSGLITRYRCLPKWVNFWGIMEGSEGVKDHVYATDVHLTQILGSRVGEGDPWGFVAGVDAAEMYARLQLSVINSEARSLSIDTLPKFGLMVNRPVYWVHRECYGNTIGMDHTLAWDSSVSTNISINHVRAWDGDFDPKDNSKIFKHFGGTDGPFNLAKLMEKVKR